MLEPIIKSVILIGGLMTAAAYLVLLERRMAAWIQDRRGPNRVGIPMTKLRLFGLGQPLADGLKFIFKEEYTPAHVDKRLYVLAPIVVLVAALAVFAVIPFGSVLPTGENPIELVVAPGVNIGVLFVFALSSIAVYGVILGGWASNNKYSFLGGLRSSAQLIAYELPLGLGLLGVVLAAGSLDLSKIIESQATTGWFVIMQPLGFIVFMIAAFAEAARLPFDLPECEQELVGGYHTEYSGMKLLLFLVGEFLHMVTAAILITILFLGGWHFPWLTGAEHEVTGWGTQSTGLMWLQSLVRVAVLCAKTLLVILFFMLVRWSWPRFRFDQLMALAWKVMLPLGLINLVAVAVFNEIQMIYPNGEMKIALIAISWAICIGAWVAITMFGPTVADNKPRDDVREGVE
ncbi:MAG: NADH-quinone oxidoreductase subunit NuoH [Planctomycetes bacterium]|nr:NADH-quinone oxidoreductase subunit NuoH [Planctomycetota bacterium]